ncbi:MAG: hypothetical protein HXX12_13920 [Geothrix sp.]|uniref:hypothetical protein n=1 Tax=Geothrix sp. TaxID=1962974 RepID=UPI0017DAC684|nr:hypothetical protein [Geothrix sp.]NWJ42055.1 hypothetical protein [Geothrix sp.]WIL19977.1 MAG: hypothetical protein QOZ81_002516 [Geothrix sp.]
MTETSRQIKGTSGSQLRSLILAVLLFDLLVIGLAGWTLANSRRQYVHHAGQTTDNLAQVLEQYLMASIRQIDLVLMSVKDEAERTDHTPDPAGIEARLQSQFSRVALLDSLRTTDAQGRLERPDNTDGHPREDLSHKPFFQHLRRTPQTGLFISHPSRDGAGGAWAITLARRMEHPAGVFRGVVFATVTLEQLTRELAQVDIGRHGSISLRGGELDLLARYPATPDQDKIIGDPRISGDYLAAVQSGRQVSHFSTHSVLDGQVRTYTFRKMTNPAFYILVGLAESEYLQTWYREALLSGSAVLGLVTLSLVLAWMARTTWRKQMDSQAERDHLIQDLTHALAEVKNLKGMLPICGHCKKIRDDQGYWNQMETYISEHTEATFSHGVCPDCAKELRQEMQARRAEQNKA